MKQFVLDCSVSAAWCLKDESSSRADKHLARLAKSEALVPGIWIAEMANVLAVAERRNRIGSEDADQAIQLLAQLPITVIPESLQSLSRIHALARKHDMAAYDASYLDLAMQRELPLATDDADLRTAARAHGIRVL